MESSNSERHGAIEMSLSLTKAGICNRKTASYAQLGEVLSVRWIDTDSSHISADVKVQCDRLDIRTCCGLLHQVFSVAVVGFYDTTLNDDYLQWVKCVLVVILEVARF
ncbi:hypothetical protein FRC03_011955 [Tulasnella sp. 419]|nr:hypothetical protein FRC03_011955 [Tulasnella sp. 419]